MELSPETTDKLNSLERKTEKPNTVYNSQQHNDQTRSEIALCFVKGFLWLIAGILLFIPLYNIIAHYNGVDDLLSLKDILLAVSGTVSGPLGFVIGHYFKSDK